MNSGIFSVATFIAGAAIGSLVTWKLVKSKYEQVAQNEINEIRDYYRNKTRNNEPVVTKEEKEQGEKLVKDLGYGTTEEEGEEGDDEDMIEKPYVIPPDSFSEYSDYNTISLFYTADGVVIDEHDNKLDDNEIESTIGKGSLDHFGEYEDDSVFVRNDYLKCDYEICKELRTFEEIQSYSY